LHARITTAVTALGDPHRSARRSFLLECRDQAQDQGAPDDCSRLSQQRFGRFNSLPEDVAFGIAGVAVFVGTIFVLVYVMRRVD